ncbi:MAG: signal peptidase II [Scrofimicrobium sp.]
MTEVDRSSAGGSPATKSPKLIALVAVVALVALGLDLVTKWWALGSLEEGVQRPFIGNFITLQLIFNPGAAFSLGEGATIVFTCITVLVIGALIWFSTRIHEAVPAVIVGLLIGGAAGNLWDRLTQPPGFGHGHVVDFINYNNWFIGNVADIWIVVAAVGLLLWVLVKSETDRQEQIAEKSVLQPTDEDTSSDV